ncbi:TIR domain-containing protein [Chryseobacterium indoltheticum]|uniref:TIR domain-containing protein n=1 Tax=Chryseobacterium indoltheticum TaxID=254 RepID=UPI004042AD1F
MAQKKGNQDAIKTSKLIVDEDMFIEQLRNRIERGKELLNYQVEVLRTQKDTFNKPYSIYKDEEQSNFLNDYTKWKQFNIELLKRSFDIAENEYVIEYKEAEHKVWADWVRERKDDIQRQISVFESIIERVPLIEKNLKNKRDVEVLKETTNKIFIVHSHNNEIKQTVARTVTTLKLEPVILHEQIDQGKTIIEKFEKNGAEVNFAIILLTADDEGKAKIEKDFKVRARQNVVFEMGYFIGKLGRDRVFLLLENGVDKPGDLDGIVYTSLDNADGWKLKLVKELKAAGYKVTADNL